MRAASSRSVPCVREMGNSTAGGNTRPRCSTTIVVTTPTHSEFFEELLLSEREKSVIQKSWTLSEQSTLLNLGQRLFQKIFVKAPESRQLFQKGSEPCQFNASFYRHIRAFMNLMEFAVSKIGDEDGGEKLWRTCFEVGKRHVRFCDRGFKGEYWATFQMAMLQCVVDWEGAHCSQRSMDSWSKLLAYVVRNMKRGYDYELARVQAAK